MTRFRRSVTPALIVIALALSQVFVTRAATTISASSCSDAAVQSAVNTAGFGDTVSVPAGSCTWTVPVTVTGKRLTLQGAGVGLTNVTLSTGSTSGLVITPSATNFVRVTGITFIEGSISTHYIKIAQPSPTHWFEVAFRLDHIRLFDNGLMVASQRMMFIQQVYGLIDHAVLETTAPSTVSTQLIEVDGTSPTDDGGYSPWALPNSIGTDKAVYVEDTQITRARSVSESITEGYCGSRIVVRFNTVVNGHTGEHGLDSGNCRGAFSQEEYGNAFTQNDVRTDAGTARGGTSLYFNNTHGGSQGYSGFTLFYPRPVSSYTNDPAMQNWKTCDGTQYDVQSATLSNVGSRRSTTYGTSARFSNAHPDALPLLTGGATGDAIRPLDGPGTHGYPCRDQLGVTHDQRFAPMYAWNNGSGIAFVENQFDCITGGSNATALCQAGYRLNHWVASDRDYYQGATGIQTSATTPFNGTTGVGWGTLANRPTTCTTGPNPGQGAGYWAIDQGSWNTSTSNPYGLQQNGTDGVLYQCTATNTWSVYYTPYTYPHPIQFQIPAPPNPPPTTPVNLKIVMKFIRDVLGVDDHA